jgi:hypothetical protein
LPPPGIAALVTFSRFEFAIVQRVLDDPAPKA